MNFPKVEWTWPKWKRKYLPFFFFYFPCYKYRKNYLNSNTFDFLTALLLITCSVRTIVRSSHSIGCVVWWEYVESCTKKRLLKYVKLSFWRLQLQQKRKKNQQNTGGHSILFDNQDWIKNWQHWWTKCGWCGYLPRVSYHDVPSFSHFRSFTLSLNKGGIADTESITIRVSFGVRVTVLSSKQFILSKRLRRCSILFYYYLPMLLWLSGRVWHFVCLKINRMIY